MKFQRPEVEYFHTHDKLSCKVCRRKLKKPAQNKTVLYMLYNRAFCSADCLFIDYDSLDKLTDEYIEYVDYLEERTMPLNKEDFTE